MFTHPEPALEHPVSQLCTQGQVDSLAYRRWCQAMGEPPRYHRKQWEFCYILEALAEAGMLTDGARGLGFGVGQEPLSAIFAARGCQVLATDAPEDSGTAAVWGESRQHAGAGARLNARGLCDSELFAQRVRYRPVDMNALPGDLGMFDFVWSSCALEHLGTLDQGIQFLWRSLECLRPGGLAVHTTEFNISSDDETLASGGTVLYRRRDVLALSEQLLAAGHEIVLNLNNGGLPVDHHIDGPPFQGNHLKLWTAGFVATSLGLIVRKGTDPQREAQ